MKEYLEAEGTPEPEAPVRNGHRYLSNRLDYPWAMGIRLVDGSSMIESGHCRVIQA